MIIVDQIYVDSCLYVIVYAVIKTRFFLFIYIMNCITIHIILYLFITPGNENQACLSALLCKTIEGSSLVYVG